MRLIIASNEELWSASQRGKFREDLFHRLNEFTIKVPPLRERREDIMLFAKHFLERANKSLHKAIKGFSPEVEDVFNNYPWYGNLRELKNVVKRTALLADGEYIEARLLPFEIRNYQKLLFDEPANTIATSYSFPPHESPFMDEKSLSSSATTLKGAMIDM